MISSRRCFYLWLLVGFGFSDAAIRPGLNSLHAAHVLKNLMVRLGFEKFYIQGGDWGGIMAQLISALYPDNVIGMHSNGCFVLSRLQTVKSLIGVYFPSLIGISKRQQEFKYPLTDFAFFNLESGYMHIQSTKPDTIGKLYFQINFSFSDLYHTLKNFPSKIMRIKELFAIYFTPIKLTIYFTVLSTMISLL